MTTAYNFDGNDDRVVIAPSTPVTLTGDFTVSWWMNVDTFDAINTHQVIGDDDHAHSIGFKGTTTQQYFIKMSGLHTITPTLGNFVAGTWYHMMLVRSGSGTNVTIYRDLVSDATFGGGVGSWSPTRIGYGFDGAEEYFALDGKIFDVRIYDAALNSADRITVNSFGDVSEPLVRWYKCTDSHNTIATDSSPNKINGTKQNITPSTFHFSGVAPQGTLSVEQLVRNGNGLLSSAVGLSAISDVFTNTGGEFIYIDARLGLGGISTIITPITPDGLATDNLSITVTAGNAYLIGPFDRSFYNDANSELRITHNFADSSNVFIGVYRLIGS